MELEVYGVGLEFGFAVCGLGFVPGAEGFELFLDSRVCRVEM